ncbi:MAG: NCS2 family permease, partial [Terrimesophilobacter sp.]
NGLGAGFIAYVLIRVVQGRAKEIHVLMWIVSAAFLVYFAVGVIEAIAG